LRFCRCRLTSLWGRGTFVCLSALHDSTGPVGASGEAQRRDICRIGPYHDISVPRCFQHREREILPRDSAVRKTFVWLF
jgi:hypothetical protein